MSSKNPGNRCQSLKALEFELAGVGHRFGQVAHTISDILDRVAAKDRVHLPKELLAILLNFVAAVLPRRVPPIAPTVHDSEVLFLQSAVDSRLDAILRPVHAELKRQGYSGQHIIVGRANSSVMPGIECRALMYGNSRIWWDSIFSVTRSWIKILWRSHRSKMLSISEGLMVYRWLLTQSRRMDHARHAVSGSSVSLVVVDYDRGLKVAPWVLAFKESCNAQVVSFLHGQLRTLTYLPTIADHILVWHRVQKSFIKDYQGDRCTQVHVVGVHWWDVIPEHARTNGPQLRVVYASSGPGTPDEKRSIATAMADLIRDAGHYPVIRPHPLESPTAYQTIGCEIECSSHVDALSSLSRADVLITGRSTMADQAAAAGITAIIFEDATAGETVRLPGQVIVSSHREIVDAISRFSTSSQRVKNETVVVGLDALDTTVKRLELIISDQAPGRTLGR